MKQQLKEIMTPQVATVSPQQTVQEAAQLMSQYNVGSVPVVDNGRCVGIVTDRDIALRAVSQGHNPSTTKVQTVMTAGVVTGTPQMDVHEAANLMAQRQIRRLPVVENGRLAGIVSLGDLATQNIYQNEAGQALSSISEPAAPTM
ncbi:CBS domain-containing protein [Desulforamulus hydrothermalis]|uniref:CBS domain-containing protein yhcV n=1 Tax=Desulforamulus hydrothermalis Lam5 = DSM 18033 TaxID=1121428 RepID=K8DZ13_9FIRM|nr:CBS domain-containing protein [Desulforamulus hydrothermalis]CCO08194.1 CBS domain-containing protein yhcV [Desulforamulus hydrothermalis Lam5 = DSM 18033]SHH22718.1 CBS domain-containing protein [Desulforamulus hydrothermalis Lam5 = DSM 18033]